MNQSFTSNSGKKSGIPLSSFKPKAYAYSRFSSAQQADGDSKRRQESMFRAWPDAEKYDVIRLHDGGVSAYTGKNRTLGELGFFLAQLRSGAIGANPVLLVENLDRISREEIETAQSLFLEIINYGASIVTLHNCKKYSKGMGLVDIMTALIELDVAHQHSAKLSMRVRAAFAARKATGAIIHNRASAPAWLRLNAARTSFEPIPERVALVKRIFELSAKGIGSESIARLLNNEGILNWKRRQSGQTTWLAQSVTKILRSKAVLGEFETKKNYFGEAIIEPTLWAQVNDRARKSAQGRGNGIVTEGNLLCGLVESGLDETKMILRKSGVRDRKTKAYVWHSYLVSNATIAGVSKHRVNYDLVEKRLLSLFENIDPEAMIRARSGIRDDTVDRVASLTCQVEESKRQILKYRRLIELDANPSASLVLDLKRFESEQLVASEGLAAALGQAEKAQAIPNTIKSDLSKPANRRALRAEIAQWCEKITVDLTHMVVWFSGKTGLRVPLVGPLVVEDVNLDQNAAAVEEETIPITEDVEIPEEAQKLNGSL